MPGRRPRAPALRRGRLRGDGLGQRLLAVDARGRLHAVLGRHHRRCSTPSGRQTVDGARRGRPARPRQAARQAGLAARAALDLVSAHDRHLADRLARARRAAPTSTRSAGRRTSSAGRSASRRASAATRRDDLRRRRDARGTASGCSRDDRYRVVDGEVDRRSRSPTRASTTSATSCSGARSAPTLIEPTSGSDARRRACSTSSRRYTALRSVAVAARPLHAQRPAVPAAHGARPGLLARDAA